VVAGRHVLLHPDQLVEFKIYKRTGTALVAVADPLPGGVTRRSGSCALFTPDGGKLLVFHENSTNPRVHVFVNNFDDTFTYIADDFDTYPQSYVRQAVIDASGYQMALAIDVSPYGQVYDVTDTAPMPHFYHWQNLNTGLSGTAQMFAAAFAKQGNMLILGRTESSSDEINIWLKDGGNWVLQAFPVDPVGYVFQTNYSLTVHPRLY
jgi:hypothetical protein